MPKILENIRENLIKEARRQILEQGYDSFSIRSVAGACNIGTGTVYNYFSSKTALVAGVLIEDWKSSTQEISDSISSSCSMECALSSIYFELSEFSHKYSNLFSSVKNELHSPLKNYHIMLRKQIADIIQSYFSDKFTAEFCSEALLTWTMEKKEFSEIFRIIRKLK